MIALGRHPRLEDAGPCRRARPALKKIATGSPGPSVPITMATASPTPGAPQAVRLTPGG